MSDGGKGCAPRPFSVSAEEYDNRWNTIFGSRTKSKSEEKPTLTQETNDQKEDCNETGKS
jgi:hypothetical protein